MKSTIMVCTAAVLGFILGTMCTHQTTVKAQSGIQVYVVKRDANDMAKKGPTLIPGQIVGFSCAAYSNLTQDCFTAYTK